MAGLHDELLKFDKSNSHTSYVTGFWFDMYLKDRRSVALNHNPFIAFSPDPNTAYNQLLVKATNTIVSSLKFYKTFNANVLEPEVFHLDPRKSDTPQFRNFVRRLPTAISFYGAYWYQAFPLDMSQFPSLFNSTRIPRKGKDELKKDPDAKHMLVMRNGNLYVFDAFDSEGGILSPEVIMANLEYILKDDSPRPKHPLGCMTTENRDVWANVREELLEAGNGPALNKVDTALFCLCLDDDSHDNVVDVSKAFLHGDDGSNRWFDKSFSVIMTKDGEAAINFEHSWGDGVAVLRYFNEVWKDTLENPYVSPMSIPLAGSASVNKLVFNLTDSTRKAIEVAETEFKVRTQSLSMQLIDTQVLGKDMLKKKKLSPDSVMQLIIQLAYWQLSGGGVAATYESCSTSAFKHGRTETVRPATAQTKKACELLNSAGVSKEAIITALQACSATHGQLTRNAAMGQGFDRHLMVMRLLGNEMGLSPSFYQDEAYSKINHIILSTSTLNSPAFSGGGFGAVVPDGFGIGYSIVDDRCGYLVTAYPERNLGDFIDCLKSSIDKISKVLI